jgi:hypothetical protein
MVDDLSMFGELEDAPGDRMVVRAIGFVLGTSAGWFHYDGLAVIFPEFQTTHPKLAGLITDIASVRRRCLAIDFYTGEVKIIDGAQGRVPKVYHTLQLQELLS